MPKQRYCAKEPWRIFDLKMHLQYFDSCPLLKFRCSWLQLQAFFVTCPYYAWQREKVSTPYRDGISDLTMLLWIMWKLERWSGLEQYWLRYVTMYYDIIFHRPELMDLQLNFCSDGNFSAGSVRVFIKLIAMHPWLSRLAAVTELLEWNFYLQNGGSHWVLSESPPRQMFGLCSVTVMPSEPLAYALHTEIHF